MGKPIAARYSSPSFSYAVNKKLPLDAIMSIGIDIFKTQVLGLYLPLQQN